VFLVGFLLHLQADGEVTPYELSVFFTVFVMLQFWNLFNAKSLGLARSAFSNPLGNPWFLIIASVIFIGQILFVQLGGEIFRTVPLTLRDWLVIAGCTSVVMWTGEAMRLVKRVRETRAAVC